jgi:hypothetical protein
MMTLMNTTPMRILFSVLTAALVFCVASGSHGQPAGEAWLMETLQTVLAPLEKQGFEFRQQAWAGQLKPELGRAVRMQLYRGLDYRIAITLPAGAAGKLTAMLLDGEGKPVGDTELAKSGLSAVISFKPRRTQVYAVAIRLVEGKKDVLCAMTTGWK